MLRFAVALLIAAGLALTPAAAHAGRFWVEDQTMFLDLRDETEVEWLLVDSYGFGVTQTAAFYLQVDMNEYPVTNDVETGPGCTASSPKFFACTGAVRAEVHLPADGAFLDVLADLLPVQAFGGPGRDVFALGNHVADVIHGGGGDDVYRDHSYNDYPTDRYGALAGDTVDLGAGRDEIETTAHAGTTIAASDGERDVIHCSGLAGSVVHDQLDAVSGSCARDERFAEPVVPRDTTPPEVTEVSPANGAQDVPLGASVSVVFSEEVDRASAEAAFSLTTDGGTRVAGAFTWDGARMTFTPAQPLAKRSNYKVAVASSVRDVAGNPMTAGVTTQFKTVRR